MDIKVLAKKIFLMAPQFSQEEWDELPEDDHVKQGIYQVARGVAVMIIEAEKSGMVSAKNQIVEDGNPSLAIDRINDLIADLEQQKKEILGK